MSDYHEQTFRARLEIAQQQREEIQRLHQEIVSLAARDRTRYHIQQPQPNRVRSDRSIPPWDGRAASSHDVKSRFDVFNIQMMAHSEDEEYDEAVAETDRHIRVHRENGDLLRPRLGNEAVDQARRDIKIILDNITYPTLIRQIGSSVSLQRLDNTSSRATPPQ